MLAILPATPTGIARLVKISLILPAVVASAYSSKGFISAKNVSTFSAVFVSAPKSIKLAPIETKPSGILNKPEPIPAKKEPRLLTPTSLPNSFAVSLSVCLVVSEVSSGNKASTWEVNSTIYPPMQYYKFSVGYRLNLFL